MQVIFKGYKHKEDSLDSDIQSALCSIKEAYEVILTINKSYEATIFPLEGTRINSINSAKITASFEGDYFIMYCDDDKGRWVPKELFITVEEWRDNQIEELCK